MKSETRDGRQFMGTSTEIVEALKDIAWGVELSLSEPIDWIAAHALTFDGGELEAAGEKVAGQLVDEGIGAELGC